MEKFNNKGTKCPTLWLGTDKMTQNKAETLILELPTTRPDLNDKDFDEAGNRQENKDTNDNKSDISFCNDTLNEKKLAISQILASVMGLFYSLI
ncbi:MAG: hypothetical protein ACK40K_07340 [Raineya sp.]